MAFYNKDQINWLINGELNSGTDDPNVGDGNMNRAAKQIWENTVENDILTTGLETAAPLVTPLAFLDFSDTPATFFDSALLKVSTDGTTVFFGDNPTVTIPSVFVYGGSTTFDPQNSQYIISSDSWTFKTDTAGLLSNIPNAFYNNIIYNFSNLSLEAVNYEVNTDVWSSGVLYSGSFASNMSDSGGTTANNSGYVLGTIDSGSIGPATKTFLNYKFDYSTTTWILNQDTTNVGICHSGNSVGTISNVIYNIGGYNGVVNYSGSNYSYNPLTQNYSEKTAQLTGSSGSSDFVLGTTFYINGGSTNAQTYSSDNQGYNSSTDSWTALTSLSQGKLFSIGSNDGSGNVGYCIGGTNGVSTLDDMEEYDPGLDSWTLKTASPIPRAEAQASYGAAPDNTSVGSGDEKLYIIGGQNDSTSEFGLNEEFNPTAETIAVKSSTGFTSRHSGTSQGVDNLVYCLYGFNSSATPVSLLTNHEAYDSALDGWSSLTNPATGVTQGSSSSIVDQTIYHFLGFDGGSQTQLNQSISYDISGDSFSIGAIPGFLTSVVYANAESVNTNVFLIGGITNFLSVLANTNQNQKLDTVGNSWSSVSTYSSPARSHVASFESINKIYIAGGLSGVGSVLSVEQVTDEYNPNSDSWVSKSGMGSSNAVYSGKADTSGGQGYQFYGRKSDGLNHIATNAIQKYDPTGDSWSVVSPTPTPTPSRFDTMVSTADTSASTTPPPPPPPTTGEQFYLLAGSDTFDPSVQYNQEYDDGLDSWSQRASIPTSPQTLASGQGVSTAGHSDEIFLVNGENNTPFYYAHSSYTISLDQYSTGASWPQPINPRTWGGMTSSTTQLTNTLFQGNSTAPVTPVTGIDSFSLSTDTWSITGTLGNGAFDPVVTGNRDTKAWIIGGDNTSAFFKGRVNHEYNMVSLSNSLIPDLIVARSGHSGAYANNAVYIFHGDTIPVSGSSDTLKMDTSTYAWTYQTSVPTVASYSAAGASRTFDNIRVMGGVFGFSWRDSNSKYSPLSDSWTSDATIQAFPSTPSGYGRAYGKLEVGL